MKNCIMLWKNDAVDLAINNQRRAFSDAYNNEVPAESKISIKNSIFRNSLIFQGLPPIKYQNLMYFPLFLPL